MIRDYKIEFENRVFFIQQLLRQAGADGIVFGNSGGKDSALVGILCKAACDDTVGIMMPCSSKQNYDQDMKDGMEVAEQFGIENRVVDLGELKDKAFQLFGSATELNKTAMSNIPPRLRMTTLYAVAASENRLVAGTGNLSEKYVGYFTKWGDGAHDFNPIADLTVTEVYEFLRYLGAPESIINKAPSAGLFEGQTDEKEMGVTYKEVDDYIEGRTVSPDSRFIIDVMHKKSQHKRNPIPVFTDSKIL